MNLPTKLTVLRLILSVVVIAILCIPFHLFGFKFPEYDVNGVILSLQYILAGVFFVIASVTDWADGYIARKYNLVTDTGKMLDAIADKVLVNSVLIILAAQGCFHVIILKCFYGVLMMDIYTMEYISWNRVIIFLKNRSVNEIPEAD